MTTTVRRSSLVSCAALLIVSAALVVHAQDPSATPKQKPFEPAEELTYKAEFSKSLLRKIDVANFKFTVSQVAEKPKSRSEKVPGYMLKLTGLVESQGFFAKLFGVDFRQQVESTVEPTGFVVQKTTKLDEQGKRVRSSETIFDHEHGQVTWVERDLRDPSRPERTVTAKFQEPIQDILSAIYFLRTRDLEVGRQFDVPVTDSGRVYQVSITVVEKKRMKTALGRVPVIRIDPQLFGVKGMIAEEGKFSIWITDDKRRVPVSAKLKTEYGTFDITLKKALYKPNAELVSVP
jgi:hypothetical protein